MLVYPVLLYIVVRLLLREGWPFTTKHRKWAESDLPEVNAGTIGSLGKVLFFFLVFFAGQSYYRFQTMYSFSMKCKGRILDVCSMAKAYLTPAQAHRLWRHINVA
eukprot:SAG25_NODE_7504_length_476_cov_48.265252_1_plen_104_part_10